jgi:SRSO17 transposase
MTPDDGRAAAEQLVDFPERFAPLFGTEHAQDHASDSLKGLRVGPARTSLEPLALLVGQGDVSGRPKFVAAGPGPDDDVPAQAQALFADELAPSAAGSSVGVVGVSDESAFTQQGSPSAGVARPHTGRLGQEDHGQVGVFLLGVTPAGSALLDPQRFLPESWCEPTRAAKDRRDQAHLPEDVTFGTQPRIAAELVRNLAVLGQVELDGVVADSESGRAGPLLEEWEAWEQPSVLEGPVTTVVGMADPAGWVPASSGRGRQPTVPSRDDTHPGAEMAAGWPASAGKALRVRAGAIGPLVFEFAAVRVWGIRPRQPGPPSWLLLRRLREDDPEVKSSLSHAAAEIPRSTLALVACPRCRVEECFADCKSVLGMTQDETRSWVGWPPPLTLVGLVPLFVTLAWKRLPNKCRS